MPTPIERRIEPRLDVGAVAKDGGSLAFPQPTLFSALGGYPSSTGVPVTPFTALQSAAVYGCVKCLAEDTAKLPIIVRQVLPTGGYRRLRNHDLVRLLRKPNRWQSPFEFWSYLVTSLALRGNGYAAVRRGVNGAPVAMIPLSPDRVSVLVSPKGWLYYNVSHPLVGEGVTLHQDDVLHLRNVCVDGGYLGVSPIAAAQDVIGLDIAMRQHGAILFRQGTQSGGVLSTDKVLSKEAAGRIAQDWQNIYGGVQNAHKIAILEQGLKFDKVGMTSEEAQFLSSRQFQVLEICRLFRVPPHKVFDLSRATFTNIENLSQSYIDDALMPIAVRIEQALESILLFTEDVGRIEFRLDFDQMLRGDLKTRFEAYNTGINGGFMSRNQARIREGWNPVAGGDELRVALNTAPAGSPDANGGVATNPQPVPGGGPNAEPDDDTEADELGPLDGTSGPDTLQ